MATEAQIAANRANARRSTGPTSEEGRAASARNALKHGICAERFVVADEEEGAWAELLADYRARHEPQGAAEEALVARIAKLAWRRDRGSAAEAAAWRAHAGEPEAGEAGSGEAPGDPMAAAVRNGVLRELVRITLYEGRLTRELAKLKTELAEVQAARRARAQAARQAAQPARPTLSDRAAALSAAKRAALEAAADRRDGLAPPAAEAAPAGGPPPAPLPWPEAPLVELERWTRRERDRLAAATQDFDAAPADPAAAELEAWTRREFARLDAAMRDFEFAHAQA